MRRVAVLLLGIIVVTSVATIGARMSSEAIAVVVGVVCGAAAGIPVSLLILAAGRRPRRYDTHEPHRAHTTHAGAYPPVVVIQGGTQAPSWLGTYRGAQMQPQAFRTPEDSTQRQFRVIGADDWETH